MRVRGVEVPGAAEFAAGRGWAGVCFTLPPLSAPPPLEPLAGTGKGVAGLGVAKTVWSVPGSLGAGVIGCYQLER